MRNLFICLCLFFSARYATAQSEFAPPGAEWYFGFHAPGLLEVRGYEHLWYAGDTLIQGVACKKIRRESVYATLTDPPVPYDTIQNYTAFFRQQGDSVLEMYAGALRLRWLMHPQPQDTFSVGSFLITVDSVKQVDLNGETFDKIWVSGVNYLTLEAGNNAYYDRLGAAYGFWPTSCWGLYDCYPSILCRYADDNFPGYDFPNPVCNVLSAATDTRPQPVAGFVRAYPNPCLDILNVDWDDPAAEFAELRIFDQQGRVMARSLIDSGKTGQISTAQWPAGLYYFVAISPGRVLTGRFVRG